MRRLSLLAALLLAATGLVGCTGDDGSAGSEGSSAASDAGSGSGPGSGSGSPTAEASDYLPVPPGVDLTLQGSDLEFGQPAQVAWQPAADRVAAVRLIVARVEKVSIQQLSAWDLDAKTRRSTPYFVHVSVTNVGRGNLAGTQLPLYLADGEDSLIPASTFESLFAPCPSRPLPSPVRPGDRTTSCLLYLLGPSGDFQGVSFYSPGFDPITWNGQVSRPKPEQPDKSRG